MKRKILAGTYTDHESKGIYTFDFEDGICSKPQLFTQISSPKYIAVNGRRIASIAKGPSMAGAALIDENGKILSSAYYESRTSCYIAWHNGRIYTANYHLGSFSVLDVNDDQLSLSETVNIRDGAGCHQVLFHNDEILIPALFLDRVLIFDESLKYKNSIRFEAGTGPRHGVFTADGSTLYLVSELSNELFRINTSDWSIQCRTSVLPEGKTHLRDTAAVRLSEDESKIYVSTRTMDIISVIDADTMRLKQTVYCGGRHPRDFILTDGYLLAANRYSNNVAAFRIEDDGSIGEETSVITVPGAVSLAVL